MRKLIMNYEFNENCKSYKFNKNMKLNYDL